MSRGTLASPHWIRTRKAPIMKPTSPGSCPLDKATSPKPANPAQRRTSDHPAGQTSPGSWPARDRAPKPAGPVAPAPEQTVPQQASGAEIDCLAPPQQPDEIGRLGPYRILQVLGRG